MRLKDRAYPKHSLLDLHGHHRRCPGLPPDPRDRARRLHARHESVLGDISSRLGLRASLPAARDLGAVLQLHQLRDRHVHQRAHEEEEAAGLEEEVSGQQDIPGRADDDHGGADGLRKAERWASGWILKERRLSGRLVGRSFRKAVHV